MLSKILFRRNFFTINLNTFSEKLNNESTFSVNLEPCKLHCLEKGPEETAQITKKDALLYYNQMYTIRKIENEAATLYKQKIIRGFCHLYAGQEACAVGIHAVMSPEDSCITAYRCHGWTYVMGMTPIAVLCELTGRQSGCSRGKGGSMHMYCDNLYGGNGIVGAHVPIGGGIALRHKYLGKKGVSITCYGDGAANQGQVAEIFNMAKLWNLPIVFVIENNLYGLGTQMTRASANTKFYKRGDLIPGILLNGMDVLAVREGARYAIDHCRTGKGPILIEMLTYRYYGHSMSDPGTSYRSREEIKKVRDTRDPIKLFKNRLLSDKIATKEDIANEEKKVNVEIDAAIQVSISDKEISVDELTYDIYANDTVFKEIRSILPNKPRIHKRLGKLSVHKS